eukprot:COSAG01_NODE_5899_length_3964_cov_3.056404_6_plen_187_part_01
MHDLNTPRMCVRVWRCMGAWVHGAQEAVLGGSVDLQALGALLVRFLSEMPEALISSAFAPGGASCPAALLRRGGGGGGVEVAVAAYLDSMPSVNREMLCMLIEFLQRVVSPMCELPMAIFAQALTHHRRDAGPAALALTTHLLQSQVIAAGGGGGGGGGGASRRGRVAAPQWRGRMTPGEEAKFRGQ